MKLIPEVPVSLDEELFQVNGLHFEFRDMLLDLDILYLRADRCRTLDMFLTEDILNEVRNSFAVRVPLLSEGLF